MTDPWIKWDDTSIVPISKKLKTLSSGNKSLRISGGGAANYFIQGNSSTPNFNLEMNEIGDKFIFWRGTFFPELNFPNSPKNGLIIDNDWYTPGGVTQEGGQVGLLTTAVRCLIDQVGEPYCDDSNFPTKFFAWSEAPDLAQYAPHWRYKNGNFVATGFKGGTWILIHQPDDTVVPLLLESTEDSPTPRDMRLMSAPNAKWIEAVDAPSNNIKSNYALVDLPGFTVNIGKESTEYDFQARIIFGIIFILVILFLLFMYKKSLLKGKR